MIMLMFTKIDSISLKLLTVINNKLHASIIMQLVDINNLHVKIIIIIYPDINYIIKLHISTGLYHSQMQTWTL